MKRIRSALAWLAVALGVAGFVALGVWQLERRTWKHDLVARVEARRDAAPVVPPADWAEVSAGRDEYRRVTVSGQFLHGAEVATQAVTELGPGYWILTPLEANGFTVLVNRGFVPTARRDPATRAAGQVEGLVTVTGLVRMSEPGGGFLRSNDPVAGRWYSRDVAAISEARGLVGPVAPYFIDADATPNPGGLPVGGLTVVTFRDNHLSYALTWFAMAAVLAGLAVYTRRRGRDA